MSSRTASHPGADTVRVELEPLGEALHVGRGDPLQDALFTHGVEFPCGGNGRCRGCRIRLLRGELPVTVDDRRVLSPEEIVEGWRLACRCNAGTDLTIEVAQWETLVLGDSSSLEITPGQGLGVAVDVGTTTLVAQLLDLATGNVLAVSTALNPQARLGADVMSRVQYAVARKGGHRLQRAIRREIARLLRRLFELAGVNPAELTEICVVGNTVMHHFFCGINTEPLSRFPFEPLADGLQTFRAGDLGWGFVEDANLRFLPCLGGFVGSDLLAGVMATKMHEATELTALLDLGTNGEVVVGNRDGLLCASTAAGPAFEGARISMGMRAATGAISSVTVEGGVPRVHVLGDVAPRGICGSGLVSAVAAGLDLGRIQPSGRFRGEARRWELACPVVLTQRDVRELQLAKGAVAAGVRLLLGQLGASSADVERVHLAGAFGNYIDRASARRIGLLDFPEDRVEPTGNTALLGAKLALFDRSVREEEHARIRALTRHVDLSSDPTFQDAFVAEMTFPAGV